MESSATTANARSRLLAVTAPTSMRYRVLFLLVLVSFISYVLRYLISAAAPSLVDEYGFSERQLGWIFGAFALSYAACQFPAGLWAQRAGARRAMPQVMVAWGVLTLVMVFLPAGGSVAVLPVLGLIIALRFVVGIFHAPLYPLTGHVTQRWFPPGQWALPNGLSSAGLTVGSAVTAPLFVLIISGFGWRWSFGLLSGLAFFGAWLWWRTVTDTPAEHPKVNAAERTLIEAGRTKSMPNDAPSAKARMPAWRQVLQNRNVLLLTLSYFCMNFVFYQLFNWMFYYLVEIRQVSAQTAGWLSSLQWTMAAIGATLGALWCDRLCRLHGIGTGCRSIAVAGLLVSGVFMLAGAVVETPWLIAVTLALCFFCHQGTEGAYWAAAISLGGRHSAAACGVMNTGGNLVGVLNALLVPWLAQSFGWSVALGSGTGFAVAGAALWWFIQPEKTLGDTAE